MLCRTNYVYNKFTNIRQRNNYLLDHTGDMFRPVNRPSSGIQQNRTDDDLLTGRNM